jgi:hypothetical protein
LRQLLGSRLRNLSSIEMAAHLRSTSKLNNVVINAEPRRGLRGRKRGQQALNALVRCVDYNYSGYGFDRPLASKVLQSCASIKREKLYRIAPHFDGVQEWMVLERPTSSLGSGASCYCGVQ